MITTDNYVRFTRIDAVVETTTGVLADLHREQLWIDVVRPDVVRIKISRGGHDRYRNQYALLRAMATAAGLHAEMPELRTFVLSRAGFAGIQRYAADWMGDNLARWDHLRLSIGMGAGRGLSGQAFVGADVGGFQGNTSSKLFLRWMQYGVLTPFCRSHFEIDNVDQYAWAFGDVIGAHVKSTVKLRYRPLPQTGAPLQRPLVFDYQYDGMVRDLDDRCLLGPDVLVAPVVEPGMTARPVYLTAPTPMETIQVDDSAVSGADGRFEWPNRGAGFVAAFTA